MSRTPNRSLDDVRAVALLLGRPPAGSFSVCLRRPDGMPAVIKNGPLLFDGTPMPTRFWLVDPALRDAVSRLEAAGVQIHYAADAVNYHWHPVPFDQQQGRMELAGRSTVRFFRKHQPFVLAARPDRHPLLLGAAGAG